MLQHHRMAIIVSINFSLSKNAVGTQGQRSSNYFVSAKHGGVGNMRLAL